jgi:hypothetical protein
VSPTSDPPAGWDGSDNTTCAGICNITSGLLQLSASTQVTLEPLQRVQNAPARLILDLNLRYHVTPGLHQLHWLPIRFHIQYKLCSIMHAIHTGRSPVYLTGCVQTVASRASRPGLRSADSSRLRTRFGERTFSHAGPAAWNSLQEFRFVTHLISLHLRIN